MMSINDFASYVQLSATIAIAFTAVQYVKSYTKALCEKFFFFDKFVDDSFKECSNLLTDKETIDSIPDIAEHSQYMKEKLKQENDILQIEINRKIQQYKKEVSDVCHAKSISPLCFFIFLFNSFILLAGGIEGNYPTFAHVFITSLCLCSSIYLTVGWIIGEKEKPTQFCDFSSLKHTTWWFIGLTILSALSCVSILNSVVCFYVEKLWWYILLAGILFSSVNFVVFVIKIWRKTRKFRDTIHKVKEELKEKCEQTDKGIEGLKVLARLNDNIKKDTDKHITESNKPEKKDMHNLSGKKNNKHRHK